MYTTRKGSAFKLQCKIQYRQDRQPFLLNNPFFSFFSLPPPELPPFLTDVILVGGTGGCSSGVAIDLIIEDTTVYCSVSSSYKNVFSSSLFGLPMEQSQGSQSIRRNAYDFETCELSFKTRKVPFFNSGITVNITILYHFCQPF